MSVIVLFVMANFIVGSICSGETVAGTIAKTKCKEYSRYAPSSKHCQVDHVPKDTFASEGNVPHVASLGYDDKSNSLICDASLINEDFLVVPAHCIVNTLNKDLEIAVLGRTNLNSSSHSQRIKIKKMIPHPDYKRSSFYNDIALIQLERKVDVNEYVRPACLYTQTEIEEKRVIISGWGRSVSGLIPDLQKFYLDLYDSSKCDETFHKISNTTRLSKGVVSETMICSGSTETDNQVITGALLLPDKENACMYDIVGVGGFGTNSPRVPSVYTRVSAYVPWIEKEVWGGH